MMGTAIYLSLVSVVVFVMLKLTGIIDLSWWWLSGPAAVLVAAVALVFLIIWALERAS